MAAPTIASMTGFGRAQGQAADTEWAWELRSVNGRGLEVKLRLPPGWDALEPRLRQETAASFARGNIGGTLTIRREAATGVSADDAVLERLTALARGLAATIPGAPPPRAELLLALPGVLRAARPDEAPTEAQAALQAAVADGFAQALQALAAARAAEGAQLAAAAAALLDEIAALTAQAQAEAATQPERHRDRLTAQLRELLDTTPALPPERLAQEVALLATKSDVREELDRLAAHIAAARALLAEAAPVGRRLDFLMQEFNREANTLCSKSASLPLTGIGLRLKAAIERLREQVQNIE